MTTMQSNSPTMTDESRSLEALQREQREAARGEFCAAVWEGGSPAELAALANAAALEGDAADRLCAQIDNARKLVSVAADLPKREKANRAAESKATKLATEIDQLETRVAELYAEADGIRQAAFAALRESEQAVQSLHGLHGRDPLAMPATRLPGVVAKAIQRERDGQEEQRRHADRAARSERIKQLESAVAARKAAETTPMRVRTPDAVAYAKEGIDQLEAELKRLESKC